MGLVLMGVFGGGLVGGQIAVGGGGFGGDCGAIFFPLSIGNVAMGLVEIGRGKAAGEGFFLRRLFSCFR
jgi:hypothetical protein